MRFAGKPPLERALERIDVVDALADERAFVEQVLVDVRHGARVLIDARLAADTGAHIGLIAQGEWPTRQGWNYAPKGTFAMRSVVPGIAFCAASTVV